MAGPRGWSRGRAGSFRLVARAALGISEETPDQLAPVLRNHIPNGYP